MACTHAPQEIRMNFSRSWSWNLRLRMQRVQITLSNPHDGTACTTTATALEEPHQDATIWHHQWGHTEGQNKTKQIHRKNTGLCSSSSPNQYRVARAPTPSSNRRDYPSSHFKTAKRNEWSCTFTLDNSSYGVSIVGLFLLLSRAGQLPSRIMVDHRIW